MKKSKFSQYLYVLNVLGCASWGGGMKENKHNVIFIYHGIQALNTKGCNTAFFFHYSPPCGNDVSYYAVVWRKNSVGHRLLYALHKPHTVGQQPEGDRRKTGRWKNFMQEITALTTEHIGTAAAQKY